MRRSFNRSKWLNDRLYLLRFGPVRHVLKKIKGTSNDLIWLAFFPVFRGAEHLFPVARFYAVLKPFFGVRAALHTAFRRKKMPANLPAFLQICGTGRIQTGFHTGLYLNHVLGFFPERLASAKWTGRCQIEGLDHLTVARQNRRPVVLAFCHFGPHFLLRFWLGVAGFPGGAFKAGKAPERTRLRQFTDTLRSKVTFYGDNGHEAAEFLKAGNLLLIGLDEPHGARIVVPFGGGWSFQMSDGAMRLASWHQADLIPCCIIDEGTWNFRIKLSPPVPKEYLTLNTDWVRAGEYLIKKMSPDFHARPDQCSYDLMIRFKPGPPEPC